MEERPLFMDRLFAADKFYSPSHHVQAIFFSHASMPSLQFMIFCS